SSPEVRGESARISPSLVYLIEDTSPFVQMQAIIGLGQALGYDDAQPRPWLQDKFLRLTLPKLGDRDPFISAASLDVLGRRGNSDIIMRHLGVLDARWRLGILLGVRRVIGPNAPNTIKKYLDDSDPTVRRAAIQWVAEEHLTEHKEAIAKSAAKEPVTR